MNTTPPIGDPRPTGQDGPAGDQRPPGDDSPAGDPRPAGEEATGTGGAFDPSDHSVAEVKAQLENADDTERERILDAERNGKARTTITG